MVTILQHDRWSMEASDQNTKTIFTSAPRGNIYDRNGNVLAENKQVFAVTFNVSSMTTEEINDSALKLVNVLIQNQEKYTDNFPIKKKNGEFYYTYDEKIEKWLKRQGFSEHLTAAQAFARLRIKYDIDESLDRYEAMEVLQEKYNLDPPISVKKMEYTYQQEKEMFWGKFAYPQKSIDEGIPAEQCFRELREDYKIDENLSDEEARKIFIVRNEIATNGFTRYLPIMMAHDLKERTIAYLEEANIPGVDITSENERYYPNGSTACHILGYMGAISESETDYYVDKLGYSATDLIGMDGVEAAMEEKLHGAPGKTTIKVNSGGEYVETVSQTEAEKGSDVYLSIDLDLQKATESALKEAIQESEHSRSGAAVAIDVKTGDVLSMASYPGFDPNIFANGISEKAWESVQAENPRDSFSPTPLLNNVTRAAVQPGSTFKPITSVAALKAGLDPYRSIVDGGHIDYGDRTYACSNWNDYRSTHGSETLEWGIGNSCNFYFYCIASGIDWNNNSSLGYDIDVDDILKTAELFGLGEETGIEIGEVTGNVPSAEQKLAITELNVRDYLYNNAHTFFPKEVADNIDKLRENLYKIAGWTSQNPSYDELITMLDEQTDVKKSQVEHVAERIKFDYFISAGWGMGDLFNISIGQGDNAYTPLQMANYLATLGNGGVKNQVSVIAGIENEGMTVKADPVDLNVSNDITSEVIKGMRAVATGGTLAGIFGNYPISVAGKTGTAENQAVRQPKSEVAYIQEHLGSLNAAAGTAVSWSEVEQKMEQMMEKEPERYPTVDDTVDEALIAASDYKITYAMINKDKGSYEYFAWTIAMAPAEEPEIAVAVMLVEGGYSSNAAPVIKEMFNEYFALNKDGEQKKETVNKTTVTGKNKIQ
ncbi:MAG: hypothetical protein IKK48_04150 [Firmicutes bacterium]|nr:hypothetical protein [Bacillota bacterium]